MYVVHQVSDDVIGYRVGANGSLTQVVRLPAGDTAEGAAISPDGRLLFVGAEGARLADPDPASVLLGFTVGADGSLTPATEVAMLDPIGVAFSPDGQHLYVSSYGGSTVTSFAVDPSGRLTERQTLPSGGDQPAFASATVLPNRGPVASFTARPGRAGAVTRFDASGSADRDGRVDRYDWDFGDGTRLTDGGPTPRHVYRAPGTYQARLTVTDDEGCSSQLVYVGQNALCLGSSSATTVHTLAIR